MSDHVEGKTEAGIVAFSSWPTVWCPFLLFSYVGTFRLCSVPVLGNCRCGRLLDVFGTTVQLVRRLECWVVALQLLPEFATRRDFDLVPQGRPDSRFEVVADGLLFHGAQRVSETRYRTLRHRATLSALDPHLICVDSVEVSLEIFDQRQEHPLRSEHVTQNRSSEKLSCPSSFVRIR